MGTDVDSGPVMLADAKIDPDKFMLAGIDTSKEPRFTVSEVAKVFFARSAHWMRWRERSHFFLLGGKDPDCPHHEIKQKMVAEEVDGKTKKVKKPVIVSWVKSGKCSKCAAKEVGARRTEEGARTYTLSDVEQIAHALAGRNAINGGQLRNVLVLIQGEARLWGYL